VTSPVDDVPEAGTAHRGLPAVGVDGHSPRRATHDPLLDPFETVTVSLDEENDEENDREFEIEFTRPDRTRDERLADLWSELREET